MVVIVIIIMIMIISTTIMNSDYGDYERILHGLILLAVKVWLPRAKARLHLWNYGSGVALVLLPAV